MNTKKYASRFIFWSQLTFAIIAVLLSAIIIHAGHFALGILLLTLFAVMTNRAQPRLCAVTLSVPEIMTDVLDAFKLETPELFAPGGFSKDFSSKTAVLGDSITAKISHLPTAADYDAAQGGFKNGATAVTDLIEDVPVTLNQFKHVPIKISWLSQLASKLPLYKEAVRNYGYVLGKLVVDAALNQCTAANFSHYVQENTNNITLDTFDGTVRNQLNTQKVYNRGRWAMINTTAAGKLGADDRVRSSLFYAALNADNGYRLWRNIAGFSSIREYPDLPTAGGMWGFCGDSRAIVVASRRPDFSNAAEELGVPKVMEFYPLIDEESGLSMTGVSWQEVGTGDVYVSAAVLFGIGAGKQGGSADTITDKGGCILKS